MRRLVLSSLFLPLISAFHFGCGAGPSDTQLPLGSGQGPGTSYRGYVLGRVKLTPELSPGPVEFYSLSGEKLLEVETDPLGWFHLDDVQLPADFVVAAQRRSNRYFTEIRGGWGGGTIYINAATSLAGAYHLAHPELTVEQVEDKVQKFYRLPAEFRLSWVGTILSDRFDNDTFLAKAQTQGLENYQREIIQQIDAPVAPAILASAASSVLGAALGGLFSASVNDAAGAMTTRMGYNFTTAGALSEIDSQLNQVSGQVSNLQSTVQADAAYLALGTAVDLMNSAAANISLQFNAVNTTYQSFVTTHPADSDYNVPRSDVVATIALDQDLKSDLEADLQNLVPKLTDTSAAGIYQLLVGTQRAAMNVTDTSYNGYPVRWNAQTRQQIRFFSYYLARLTQAGYLQAEYSNTSPPNLQPGQAKTAYDTISNTTADIQLAAQQVPDLLMSDDLMVDIPNGLMWHRHFQGRTTATGAANFAANLTVGPYRGDWRLPSQAELENLVKNRVARNTNPSRQGDSWDDTSSSNWKSAFNALGFDTTNYSQSYLPDATSSHQDNEGAWAQPTSNQQNFVWWWNNTGKNPSSNTSSQYQISYLVCRPLPGYFQNSSAAEFNPPASNDDLLSLNTSMATISPLTTGTLFTTPTLARVDRGVNYGVQLTASGQFFSLIFELFLWRPLDLTSRVAWSSSNTQAATISNLATTDFTTPAAGTLPGPAGWVTWHPPLDGSKLTQPVTFTARYFSGSTTSASQLYSPTIQVTPPNDLVPVLKQVQPYPTNLQVDLTKTQNGTATVNCTLLAYYQDGQVADVSGDPATTWTLTDQNNQTVAATSSYGFNQPGSPNILTLSEEMVPSQLTIKAHYAGRWGTADGSTRMVVIKPALLPAPTNMAPVQGSAGSSVTILGTNLAIGSEIPRVTFAGVASPRVEVITTGQLNVQVPSGPSGQAPVVITTSQGDSSASPLNFFYQ